MPDRESLTKIGGRIGENVQTALAKDPAAKSAWEVIYLYARLHAI